MKPNGGAPAVKPALMPIATNSNDVNNPMQYQSGQENFLSSPYANIG